MMVPMAHSIEWHARAYLVRDAFSRSPLFHDAMVSGPISTPEGEVALNISFDGGPDLFRVVARSEEEAFAILHELAVAMVEVDEMCAAAA
jgi:hypothetical protein